MSDTTIGGSGPWSQWKARDMWLVTRKGLVAHKLRLAMTALAVVLGVGFVAGSFMLTDTIERSFSSVFEEIGATFDLYVRAQGAGDAAAGGGLAAEATGIPPELLAEVREVDGVAAADPIVYGQAQLIGDDGEPVGAIGAPTMAFNAPGEGGSGGGMDLRDGRHPEQHGEVAVDAYTARTQDLSVGDPVTITAGGPVEEVELVGIVGFGQADNLAGATAIVFDFDTAMERFSPEGTYDEIEIHAGDGVDLAGLVGDVQVAVGDDYDVLSAEEFVEETMSEIAGFLDVFSYVLLAFAAIALFVGMFIIVNTFSITVAQRVRELALLRAVGASRRQVLGSVLTEAGVLGIIGGVTGLAVGGLLAFGLRAMLDAFGMELPADGLVVAPRTVVVALLLGVVVTVAAALVPALRATRIAPVQALQSVAAPPQGRGGWVRPVMGVVVTVLGVVLLAVGLAADGGVMELGSGAAAVFVGIVLLSPLLTRPLVGGLGMPVARLRGMPGELASENARRNPRRTATTSSALMIGVGLVGFVTVLSASLSASMADAIDDVYRLDLDVRSTGFQPIPGRIGDELAELDEVDLALTQRRGQFEHDGEGRWLIGVDTSRVTDIYAIETLQGSLDALPDGGIAISEDAADRDGVDVGSQLPVTFPSGEQDALEVAVVFDVDPSMDIDYMIDVTTHRQHYRSDEAFAIGVRLAEGVDLEQGQAAVDGVLESYPGVAAMDRAAVRDNLTGQINQMVGLVYGLLALAVIIAFVGIVNTLALSVFERVREIGLLRAVGMSRRQVRSMVRWESVLISLLGVVLGLAVGVFFGWLLVEALQDDFPMRLVVPGGQLVSAVLVAALAGVLAGVLPARRAARVDVLEAITSE